MFTMFKIQRLTFLHEFLLSCPSCSSCKSCSDFQAEEEPVGVKVLNPKQDFHDVHDVQDSEVNVPPRVPLILSILLIL